VPFRSEQQKRLMYAVADGKVPSISKSIGEEFINSSHGMKNLPKVVDDKVEKFNKLKKYMSGCK